VGGGGNGFWEGEGGGAVVREAKILKKSMS
jgi:hypothetical protein